MNKDYNRREEIMLGAPYNRDDYFAGCKRFVCGLDKMKQLLEEGFIDPNESQNDSPTTKEFIEYAEDFDNVMFECYAISPDRDDYRITIEGINLIIPDADYDKIATAIALFRYADEFSFDHNYNEYMLHAWWD